MKIILYDEGIPEELALVEVAGYLGEKLGKVAIELAGSPWHGLALADVSAYAQRMASVKVQQVNSKEVVTAPLYAEIEYEKRRLLGKTRSFGVPYDGFQLVKMLFDLMPAEARGAETINIVFTNRLLATWDSYNKRYHLRTSVYGIPSIISTTGLIEAPARSRDYYLLKQQYEMLGKDLTELNDHFRGSFLDYGDKRLTDVARGYAMQAVFFSLTGQPFCEDKGCKLYNAHWQAEMLYAQLESSYEFCPKHARILQDLASGQQKS
ncbi:MAG: hypothetical protein HY670_01190 [Chloroflexi bacterium]|nr:hypothetical protein [Chloroflexota bacterium]